MLFDIKQFHDATVKIPTKSRTLSLVNKIKKTAKAHNDEFPPGKYLILHDKVNNFYKGKNWFKLRVGRQSSTGSEAIIVYHMLKHAAQLTAPQQPNLWSISLGVDHALMPKDRINETVVTDLEEPFVMLGNEILDMVHSDVAGGKLGDAATIAIYDHVYPIGAIPPQSGIQDAPGRRTTRIGELGWVAEQIIAASAKWNVIEPSHMVARPTWTNPATGMVEDIPGWGRDGAIPDRYCVRTSLEPV